MITIRKRPLKIWGLIKKEDLENLTLTEATESKSDILYLRRPALVLEVFQHKILIELRVLESVITSKRGFFFLLTFS